MDSKKTGDFIRKQRLKCNLTQKDLAQKLGCTDKAVSRWETGKGIPDVSFLIPLSNNLNVSVNEILIGEKIEKEQQIEKYEQIIVDTISESKNKISRLNIVIYILFIVIEIFSIYFFTIAATPSDGMGLVIGLVLITQINSLLFGMTNIKFKYKSIYPWIATIAFIPSNYIYWGSEALETALFYGFIHLASSYIFILAGTGISKIVSVIITKIKEKRKNR